MSLLITIFALAYSLYLRLFHSSLHVRQRKLKTEILATKKELIQTSAQDQFAKWAKLRRSVDKGLADLEKLSTSSHLRLDITVGSQFTDGRPTDAEVASNKSSFKMKFNGLIWSLTTGLQFIVGWWYRKSAVFYLPAGWFGPLEWWLSFPFAPAGSVSVGVWQMACRRVIKVGERVVKDLIASTSCSRSSFLPNASPSSAILIDSSVARRRRQRKRQIPFIQLDSTGYRRLTGASAEPWELASAGPSFIAPGAQRAGDSWVILEIRGSVGTS
ncbi:GET complex [Salix suchowensis]|nr:GET complex [Salix suchowensis]